MLVTDMRGRAEAGRQIAEVIALLDEVLVGAVLGVYLYGSSVLGGRQRYSDIDLLAVVARPTTHDEKRRLVGRLLAISGVDPHNPRRPIELTVVVQAQVRPWRYPPRFDFQYGDWLRGEFEAGNVEPWPTTAVPDLALLLTQVRLASEAIVGPPVARVLDPVPYRDFLTATVSEIDAWMATLEGDTRGVLLALARMWYTVETDAITSKGVAADWALPRLPDEYRPPLARARAIYLGETGDRWDDLQPILRPCADFMIARVRERMAQIDPDDGSRAIRLPEP